MDKLLKSNSEQLEKLARLSDERCEAIVKAMNNTLAFSIDSRVKDDFKDITILTIGVEIDGIKTALLDEVKNNPHLSQEINNEKGIVGHAVLNFRNKGSIFVSSSHWIDLSNIRVDRKKLINELQAHSPA